MYDFGGFSGWAARSPLPRTWQGHLRRHWSPTRLTYFGSAVWPVGSTGQCTVAGMKFRLGIAFWRAEKRLPPCLYTNGFKRGVLRDCEF